MSALDRLHKLREHLLSLDSASGEASDLALILAVIEAAKSYMSREHDKNRGELQDALAALTKD